METVSRTFHGRDIIAPVGAHIARGVDFHQLGPEITPANAVRLNNLQPRISNSGEITGTVVAVDHFGNLISNIDYPLLAQIDPNGLKNKIRIQIGSHTIDGIYETYENGRQNIPMALFGSRGYLEVAVNQGNAAQVLNAKKGDSIRVII